MITIAICDDDNSQINALKKMLTEWNSNTIISEYNSAEQFLFNYPDVSCDLLLLDIEMGDMNGMELAKELRAKGDMLPIIFITGFSQYIGDGYDVEALHYLMKPVDKKKLFQVLDRYAFRHKSDSRVILPIGNESVLVASDDIVYLEAFGKKTQVTLNDGKEIVCTCGLSEASEKLGQGFVSCHRSYVVNIGAIRKISRSEITMDSGKKIPISRRSYDSVNRAFIEYYKEARK
ncbi:MAG: LytTR family DNA-binding domain-containing protein [Oscillospiraceae bacterium]|nr:LytTR family DNA-binding domain-containing protein [Oscillospiraceae bacterium]